MSSGLPEVNVGEGFRSVQSASGNFAKVQEGSPVRNKTEAYEPVHPNLRAPASH